MFCHIVRQIAIKLILFFLLLYQTLLSNWCLLLAKALHENISNIYLSITGHQPCASKDWFCSGLFSIAFSKTYVGNDTHFLFSSTKLFLEGWDSRQLAPLGKVDQKLFYLWKVLLCVTFYWLLDFRQSSGSHTSIVSFSEVGNDLIFFSVWRNCI